MTLSKDLAAIVGAKKDEKLARSEIIKRLWAYLKSKDLQVQYQYSTKKIANFIRGLQSLSGRTTIRSDVLKLV